MKKQIKDLKLNDSVWMHNGANEIIEFKVTEISLNKLKVHKEYDSNVFEMTTQDHTCFNFKTNGHYPRSFFLSKLDALKERRKSLDLELGNVFKKQQRFLENIQDANNNIRQCDAEIAEELKKV